MTKIKGLLLMVAAFFVCVFPVHATWSSTGSNNSPLTGFASANQACEASYQSFESVYTGGSYTYAPTGMTPVYATSSQPVVSCNATLNSSAFSNSATAYCTSPEVYDSSSQSGCSPAGGVQNGQNKGNCQQCDASNPGTSSPSRGEPIDIASGNVFYQATDYSTAGPNKLQFIRYYNSRDLYTGMPGPNWHTNFEAVIFFKSTTSVLVQRADGRTFIFTYSGGAWHPNSDADYTLTVSSTSFTTAGTTWTLTGPDDTVDTFTTNSASPIPYAVLNSIARRNGYTQTLVYNSTTHLLSTVTDSYGRQISFAFNSANQLTGITTPDSTTISYGYSGSDVTALLTSVTFPTSPATSVTYAYGNSTVPNGLTSITDENGHTYETWTYDAYGRGLTNYQGVSGVSANAVTLTYNDSTLARTVTNALGVADTYSTSTIANVPRVTSISRAATSSTAAATESMSYDSNGYLSSMTDWNGNVTNYTNNGHGLPTQVVEAYGSAVSRTTTIAYDTTWVRLPATVTTPGLTITSTYDSQGELLTKTLTDTTTGSGPYSTNGQTRTWTYTWANALPQTVKTPRNYTTTYTWDSTGALTNIQDALSHNTQITSNTGGGRPLTIVDPNGVTTTLTYNPRQWLLTSSIAATGGPFTSTLTYDAAGNLTRKTLPDGSYTAYTLDDAHRITQVADALGSTLNITLDALGDKTDAKAYTSGGTLSWQHDGTFDALGRVLVDTAGAGQTTTTTYDPDGNALTIKDGDNNTTTRVFDALNRLTTSTDALSGVVTYAYNPHDKLTSLTDTLSHATSWTRDGFDDAIQEVSPDRGTTVYHFDADGNLTQKLDASSNTSNQTFDAVDRILTTSYPADSTLNVSYTYDQATGHGFGIGQLTSLTDASGSLSRSWDERANLLSELRTNGTTSLTTSYGYDAASRINGMTYPSGTQLAYTRNAKGDITNLAAKAPGASTATNLVSSIAYAPFGPMKSWSWFNGGSSSYGLDADYRITTIDDLSHSGLTWDNANNLSATDSWSDPNYKATYGYDALNRLTSAQAAYGYGPNIPNPITYSYDANGNNNGTGWAYTSGTNRAATLSYTDSYGPHTQYISYTGTGNISDISLDHAYSYFVGTYNAANRLSHTTNTGPAETMTYDFQGQRIYRAQPSGAPTLFSYDQGQTLLEKHNDLLHTDYIYLNGRLIGMEGNTASGNPEALYAVYTRYLGSPYNVLDASGNSQWSEDMLPFGIDNGTGANITQSLRQPGQYLDSGYGFVYNIQRDYFNSWGRYLQADPIGLAGGMNPYAYAEGNPLKNTDEWGLIGIAFPTGHPYLAYPNGSPVIDPNTQLPYPNPVGMDIPTNILDAQNADDASLIWWFRSGGPEDYQRPNGWLAAVLSKKNFIGGNTDVTFYNFGVVCAAAGKSLEATLDAAGFYNQWIGRDVGTNATGLRPNAMRIIPQGWGDYHLYHKW